VGDKNKIRFHKKTKSNVNNKRKRKERKELEIYMNNKPLLQVQNSEIPGHNIGQ
jgi:hypothetical protein